MHTFLGANYEFDFGGVVCIGTVADITVASSHQFCANDCRCGDGGHNGRVYVGIKYAVQPDRFVPVDFGPGIGIIWYNICTV